MDTHRYMLDTNIVSDLIRRPGGAVFQHLERVLPDTACTSIVVAAEIRYGLASGASDAIRQQAEVILGAMDILPLEPPLDEHYGDIRAFLKRSGQPIGANDLFIAAHARALGMILVTANVREFSRVPDLQVENWLSA
jgi:tRNA(fMet)-specific endonuclease VapC